MSTDSARSTSPRPPRDPSSCASPSPEPGGGHPTLVNRTPGRVGQSHLSQPSPPHGPPGARPRPPLPLDVGRTRGEDVDGGEARLLARRNEDNDGLLGRVLGDGVVHRLGHGQQASLCVANVEALETDEEERRLQTQGALDVMRPRGNRKSGSHLDVQLQGHGAHVRVEVEGGGGAAPQPVGHVLRVRERGAEGHNANGPLDLGGDVAHPGADHL